MIDFCVGWGPWPSDAFLETIREHCAYRKLSFLACGDKDIRQMVRNLESGKTRVGFYLDANAELEDRKDPYTRLAYAAKDSGALLVNDPDLTRLAINKAVIHYHFVRAGIPVPYTVVVRSWEPTGFELTREERKGLGKPFIAKPAHGYAKEGVALLEKANVETIAKARRHDRKDDFLLQELVEPDWFGHYLGWFRAYYLFGQAILCWWDPRSGHYAPVTREEFECHELYVLYRMVWRIARVARMNYFSTELAVQGSGSGRRVQSIDYVNDNCDMTLQSFSCNGVPDRVVHHVAEGLVEAAWQWRLGMDPADGLSLWFPE
jgi:hypothetical protein